MKGTSAQKVAENAMKEYVYYAKFCRLPGCFGLKGHLIQYFSLYWTFSREKKKEGRNDRREKNVQTTPPPPTASTVSPCRTIIKIVTGPPVL